MKIKPKTIFKIIDRIAKVDAEAYELYETLSLTRDEDAEINENDLMHFIKEIDKLLEKTNNTWEEVKGELKRSIKQEHKK